MAARILITLAILAGVSLPAHAAPECVIIYANDMGAAVTREIRNHELGHLLCPEWRHPPRLQANGKAYPPPSHCFNRKLTCTLYEFPVSTAEARYRCAGDLGCIDE